jgi:hypothetical protein
MAISLLAIYVIIGSVIVIGSCIIFRKDLARQRRNERLKNILIYSLWCAIWPVSIVLEIVYQYQTKKNHEYWKKRSEVDLLDAESKRILRERSRQGVQEWKKEKR